MLVLEGSQLGICEETVPGTDDNPPQYGVLVCFKLDRDAPWQVITGSAWDSEEEREAESPPLVWLATSTAQRHNIDVVHMQPEEVSA